MRRRCTFRLDKYLVTVGRFRQFVTAWNGGSGYAPTDGSGKHSHLNAGRGLLNVASDAGTIYETGWRATDNGSISPNPSNLSDGSCDPVTSYSTWTATAGGRENFPINCVSWYEAYAFCIWDGGFLPSEAELEYAAAGGSDQRAYPWGSAEPGATNRYAIYGDGSGRCYYPSGALAACMGASSIAPVGSAILGAARWGQLDMGGEVFEWTLDSYARYVTPCVDCAFTSGSGGMTRGGSFDYQTAYMHPSYRHGGSGNRSYDHGFRCARTP